MTGCFVMVVVLKSGLLNKVMNHRAVAVVRLEERERLMSGCFGGTHSLNLAIRTAELVESDEVLDLVVEDDGFTKEELREMISTKAERESSLISIVCSHPKREIAVSIANRLAGIFVAYLNECEISRADRAVEALDLELREQGDLVQDHRKTLTVLVQQYGFPENYFAEEENRYQQVVDKLEQLETKRKELSVISGRIPKKNSENQIRVSSGIDEYGNQTGRHYRVYRKLIREKEELSAAGLGESHPKVRSVEALVIQARNDTLKATGEFLEFLEDRDWELENKIEDLRAPMRRRGNYVDPSMRIHQFKVAKAEYQKSLDLYFEMVLKQAEMRAYLGNVGNVASVHQRAE